MIKIIFGSIKRFYIGGQSSGVLFSFMLLICIISAFFAVNQLSSAVNELASYNEAYRTFTIYFIESESYSNIEKNITNINKVDIENIEFVIDSEIPISAFFYKSRYTVNWGSYFDDSYIPQIVISTALEENIEINDNVLINNTEYLVTGKRSPFLNCHEINFKSLKSNDKIMQVNIILKDFPSKRLIANIYENLNRIFENAIISEPLKRNFLKEYTSQTNFYILIILLILAFVNVIAVYNFILLKREIDFSIYRICGCSSLQNTIIILTEMIIVFLVHFIFSLLVYKLIVEKIMISAGLLTMIISPIELIVCLLVNLIVAVILLIPTILKYYHRTPKQLYYSR